MSLRTCPNCGFPKYDDRPCEYCPHLPHDKHLPLQERESAVGARIEQLERAEVNRRLERLERATRPPPWWQLALFGALLAGWAALTVWAVL